MKRFGIVLLLLISLSWAALAQNSDDVISVRLISSKNKLQPGKIQAIALEVSIKEPYHINSDQPTEDFLVPTIVTLTSAKGIQLAAVEFPPAVIKALSFSTTPLAIYEEKVILLSSITIPDSFSDKELTISGSIEYQACDDIACLAPQSLDFSQTFSMAAPGESVDSIHQDIFSEIQDSVPSTAEIQTEAGTFAETIGEKGLFITFLLIFLGGLALNLTPCVYPLIPITIGYFGGQAQGKKGGIVAHAFLYILGMAATYSTLGMIAALSGNLFGAAMQNPFVLIGIGLVLVGLALSMFNLYEFRLPSFLTKLAGGQKKGFIGTFFMGLTVGFVAAPCIGPFVLGLLTYVGERGDVFLGFMMFFVLALGLGLPFLFLAIFSGSIDRLPSSGAWMIWVRAIFGFILIAMAVYFLQPLFPNILVYHLTLALIFLIGGIYMAWMEPTKMPGKAFSIIRNLIGILFFVTSLLIASSGIQTYIQQSIKGVLLEAGTQMSQTGIHWAAYSDSMVEQAVAESKPVLIDFYADWCIPCKELDKLTFSDQEVIEMSRNFVMLKVDLTTTRDPLGNRLKKKYQIKGVPTLVLLKSNGEEAKDLRVVGFQDKDYVLKIMSQVLGTRPEPRQ